SGFTQLTLKGLYLSEAHLKNILKRNGGLAQLSLLNMDTIGEGLTKLLITYGKHLTYLTLSLSQLESLGAEKTEKKTLALPKLQSLQLIHCPKLTSLYLETPNLTAWIAKQLPLLQMTKLTAPLLKDAVLESLPLFSADHLLSLVQQAPHLVFERCQLQSLAK